MANADKRPPAFRAYWVISGQEIQVFPNRKKTNFFRNYKAAFGELCRRARLDRGTRGIIVDDVTGETTEVRL